MRNLLLTISLLCVLACLAGCSLGEDTGKSLSDVRATNSAQEQTQPQGWIEDAVAFWEKQMGERS